jgi:ribonuclease HI
MRNTAQSPAFPGGFNHPRKTLPTFMKQITLYTDGACSGNPGPGGFGAILDCNGTERTLACGYKNTTNNRMELMGVIKGLEALKEPCTVTLVSDSRYVIDALEKGWAAKWRMNRWMRNKKDKALNPDLWQKLLDLTGKHTMKYKWVNGHAGHPQNERCDMMAVAACSLPNLEEDTRN